MRYTIIILFLTFTSTLRANDSIVVSRLLARIDALQVKKNGIFPKGSIPSYRKYALNQHRWKADINPFFTGLVAFTLNDIKKELSPSQQQLAENIITRTFSTYPKFQNRKKNRDTYNFWPTDSPQIFPHAGWLNLFNKSRALPDDLDDTVIILMAQSCSDSIARAMHEFMQGYTNHENKRVTNTFPEYQKLGAYSTWFGEKMPVDFDISVLSNVLYFVQYHNLPWTAADSASLYLIEDIIKTGKHSRYANYVSPHYATLPNILYHISRLMALKPIASLEKLKPQLIEEAKKELASAAGFMDKVILSTSLLRWNVIPPDIIEEKTNNLIDLIEDDQFYFFIASMASMLPDNWKKRMTRLKLGTFYYYAPGYNHTLLLENMVWRKRRELSR
ncbi:hypothetical protein [Sediminibacterium goheungense]|uniref:Uncharacterized protein n=1 Tax=Sediminibacterium goheungense TaxID=1086393 RepID=A0A4R6IZF5_9BACT|nr:hypothetical protein [Sediminibacterium goheungense]TDO28233.1 hypothetical protein BC659_0296 [Sediminibacterium goheungense]